MQVKITADLVFEMPYPKHDPKDVRKAIKAYFDNACVSGIKVVSMSEDLIHYVTLGSDEIPTEAWPNG